MRRPGIRVQVDTEPPCKWRGGVEEQYRGLVLTLRYKIYLEALIFILGFELVNCNKESDIFLL